MGKTLERHEIDLAARAAHEVNRTWNMGIGSNVDPMWEQLSEDSKRTARLSVVGIVTHDFNAEQTHSAWLEEMKASGWTHGDIKDTTKKTHHCLVPWSKLPSEFQVKDELWVDTVKSIIRHFWRVPQ